MNKIQWAILLAVIVMDTGVRADVFGTGTNLFSITFVDIGSYGNTGDSTNTVNGTNPGSVDYSYRMGLTEVTIDQFTKAMGVDNRIGGGDEGYWNDGVRTVGTGAPVSYCTWFEAARFANWLTTGDAYAGTYQFDANGALLAVDRNAALASYGTVYVLPSEDEWYKAAYYKSVNDGSYSIFSSGFDSTPIHGTTNGWNYSNFDSTNYMWESGFGGVEQNGTYDMGGNVWEWTESAGDGTLDSLTEGRVIRGGSSDLDDGSRTMESKFRHNPYDPTNQHKLVGFRIAAIPAYWLDITLSGSGTVNVVDGWQATGTILALVATPDAGWLFAGWSGDLSGDYTTASTNVVMDDDTLITAVFSDDADGDGLTNSEEGFFGTDPWDSDSDHDGMPDGWEVEFVLDPLTTNALADADSDGRADLYEFAMGGDPTNGLDIGINPFYVVTLAGGTNWLDYIHARSTNAAVLGLSYTVELSPDPIFKSWANSGYSTIGANGLGGGYESVTNRMDEWVSTNLYIRLTVSTSNAVVYSVVTQITELDFWAGGYGLYGADAAPTADPDSDNLSNAEEYGFGTNPFDQDTDGDSFGDGLEVVNGGSPLVSDLWRIDYIRNNGSEYDLYPSNSVLDISIGQAGFAVTNGTAWLSLQLEESTDLITWTNAGDEVTWSIPVDLSNAFYRVRSGR